MTRVFKHSGALGDIIYSLPTIIAMGGGELWMRKWDQYVNAHTLFEAQRCLGAVHRPASDYSNDNGVVDLDVFREIEWRHRTAGDIRRLSEYFLLGLGVEFDLSRPWLDANKRRVASIVVHRSTKYHDKEEINWQLLRGRDVVFVGWEMQWRLFDKAYGLEVPFHRCEGLLEMAEVIHGCDLFVGNQSSGFAIAEALKVPRVLEVYHTNPNCMPASTNGHTELTIDLLEEYCGRT